MGMQPYRLLENNFLNLKCSANHIVLEIGSERGSGSSEWLYNWAKLRNMDFHSVDVTNWAINTIKNPKINFHVAQSGSEWCKNMLPLLNKKIKILYLDNFDWICEEWKLNPPDWVSAQISGYASRGVVMNNENSQNEHLLQTQYCLPYMDEESIVIVDDTYYDLATNTWSGKCAKVMPLLENNGYKLEGNPEFGKWATRKCSFY